MCSPSLFVFPSLFYGTYRAGLYEVCAVQTACIWVIFELSEEGMSHTSLWSYKKTLQNIFSMVDSCIKY
ncbi:hypothetical protein CALK_1266 [Chitinivibrio alkaliphilus ACht1]|uniref:Uncharacterized protein n=1 Tax=Chitinivibrio alkaliphilus ACht1 TaxID=1313304 RepID=U7D5L0_9BACT|nr:hypothetical protein CALK_1266 [Chitinivibrio alkaliphilus ACht1]